MAALALFFFAAMSLNLFLNFALGIHEILRKERTPALMLCYPWIIIFVSTVLFWVFFARVLFFTGGLLDFILIFPLSALGSMGLEKLFFRLCPFARDFFQHEKKGENTGVFSVGSSFSGLAAAALFLTLRFALSFADAFLLSLAFSSGALLALLIIKEIQKRSLLETIPHSLRGTPILLISMGILSLVFSAASVLFLKIFL